MSHPLFEVISREPKFKDNYDIGYVGFTYSSENFVSQGIAYFTRWARMSQIKVSHALLVSGEDECIEAHAQGGVKRSQLSDYFNDQQCQIFFRKPLNLTDGIAQNIIKVAEKEIGCKYDIGLIPAHAASNNHIGKLINNIFGGKFENLVCKLKNNDNRWICSELVAYCLDEQLQYKDKGILEKPSETIDPQELFEDPFIFQPWVNDLS